MLMALVTRGESGTLENQMQQGQSLLQGNDI